MYRWGDVEHKTVVRIADGATIPAETANPGYRNVLAWVAVGNAIQDFDLAGRKAMRLIELAAKRYAIETAGIEVAGYQIKSDRESQALIDQMQRSLADATMESVKFKTAAGPIVDCNAALATVIRAAIVGHVQACRTHEAELAEQIEAASTAEALAAIDIAAGWPG